ncbi:unnamed protein product [Ilex paraguariensis]|uniref:rRNA methyltransferase YlbH n=1 Tax=Ilex paraguariensis TaxID=185542 RepID=A0ABC8TKM1_9AQUA
MAVSSPPVRFPLRLTTTTTDRLGSCCLISPATKTTTRRRPAIRTFSYSKSLTHSTISPTFSFSKTSRVNVRFLGLRGMEIFFNMTMSESNSRSASDQNRELLEKYGLNPDEFLSEPSPKTRRRKELQKTGGGNQVSPEKSKPPRETHKLLQVLGGKARRKKLLSPKGMDVRPMMEVVKAAAFGILQAAGGCPASLRSGRWLDLYSGTGSVGIEAISRGCSEVHFVEMDPWVVSDVLRPNLEWTGFLDVSVIHPVRVENFLERAERIIGGPFDYISVTPPYTQVDYGVLMNQISSTSVVGEDTFIVSCYLS